MLVRFALEKLGGFHVDICGDGSKGLAVATAMCPDLIMLDVMMPRMDGPSLLRAINQSEQLRGTPVVFITARVQPSEIDKYSALGAAGVISKPFNPVTLPKIIREFWTEHYELSNAETGPELEKLRQQYLKNLSTKRLEIEAFLRAIHVKPPSHAAVKKMGVLVHNLAGSGESYGYHAISKSAKIMEKMLGDTPCSPRLSNVIAKLIAAIDHVLDSSC